MADYRVTVHKDKPSGMYDCRIWRDGCLIQAHSGTLFDLSSQAREYGKDLVKQYKAAEKMPQGESRSGI